VNVEAKRYLSVICVLLKRILLGLKEGLSQSRSIQHMVDPRRCICKQVAEDFILNIDYIMNSLYGASAIRRISS